jgi:hypothetical protein
MTDQELIKRLLFLAETAVDQALDLNYDDLEDYFIYRELRELKAAALAQPEPQGASDEELLRIYRVATPCYQVEEYKRELDFARAVLDRWGRPAIEPVPVSERLPGPEDCDAEGRCWLCTPSSYVMVANWVYEKAEQLRSWNTHWAPHWALPVPGVEGADG